MQRYLKERKISNAANKSDLLAKILELQKWDKNATKTTDELKVVLNLLGVVLPLLVWTHPHHPWECVFLGMAQQLCLKKGLPVSEDRGEMLQALTQRSVQKTRHPLENDFERLLIKHYKFGELKVGF